jgi:hypothetical protein
VTEPTQEQIVAQLSEAIFVLSTTRIEDGPAYWALLGRIATALARRALEVRDEALELAEAVCTDVAERTDDTVADDCADAIRALRDGAR